MRFIGFLFLISFLTQIDVWSQDTIRLTFDSKSHRDFDFRRYDYELDTCVVFIENRFISGLSDGIYLFEDSVSGKARLKGQVLHGRLVNKWIYFDTIGRRRIEDVFLNDADSIFQTSYYDENGYLYRTKESSDKFLRTIHYSRFGMESYFYRDYSDSSDVQMEFFPNGNLRHRSSDKNGQKNGEYFWAYDDGTLYAQQFFDRGLKTGIWRCGFKGSKQEWCTEIYENDKLKQISFRNGLSFIISMGEYEIIDRYTNGKTRLKGKVVDGNKVGTWCFYDEKGAVIGKFNHDSKGNLTSWSTESDSIPAI